MTHCIAQQVGNRDAVGLVGISGRNGEECDHAVRVGKRQRPEKDGVHECIYWRLRIGRSVRRAKMAVFKPIPTANESAITKVNSGFLARMRRP
jgi:hypothetical protein